MKPRIEYLIAHLKHRARQELGNRYPDRLFSWGGKDADLDPEGDWWIEKLVDGHTNQTEDAEECVVVFVKGRKTFTDPTNHFELTKDQEMAAHEQACEMVCDAVAGTGQTFDGDEDGWYTSLELRVGVPWKYRPNGQVNYPSTLRHVLRAAEKAADEVGKAWKEVDDAMENLYNELADLPPIEE